MATMDASQVTVGSALATGAIWVAPMSETLPTDATTAIPNTFSLLGFTSDAGVQIAENSSSDPIRAWEERTEVYNLRTEFSESVSFMPIQCNEDVAKLTWGADNVTTGTGGELTVHHHGRTLEPVKIVIETTPREGIVKRFCMTAQLTERGEQTMDGTQVDGRQLTFKALADENGVTMYEYVSFTTNTTTNGGGSSNSGGSSSGSGS